MMKIGYINIKTWFSFVLLLNLFLFSSCEENKNPIPTVYVDIYIDLNDPLYYDLQSVGSYVYITGGVNGILIYRSSADEFRAYDRTCPYDPDIGRVVVDDANLNAVDSVGCKSEFSLLLDGAVSQGPSQFPLKAYTCIYDMNAQMLHIKN
ncbi:MAG: hypothetical protein J7K64_03790 [Bacteroidales bacterium]|nr:hypothetical protein [Bacteroidales bacterium]